MVIPFEPRRRFRRLIRDALRFVLFRYARARPHEGVAGNGRVVILLVSAWGLGGTIRTVHTVAGHLAEGHDVEILSGYRRLDEPQFPFAPGVRVTALDDERPGATPVMLRPLRRILRALESVLMPSADIRYHNYSLWTDVRLVQRLRRGSGVLMGTRPGLNVVVAELALPGFATVGQEHLSLDRHRPALRERMLSSYGKLDALVVLTETDRRNYEEAFEGSVRVWQIPNSVEDVTPPFADPAASRMVAAGRLTAQKGFDLLLDALGPVVAAHPEWRLSIFGRGHLAQELERQVVDRDLSAHVALRGVTSDLPGEMARASVYVLSSRYEGFPMVLIEAMSKGMACVAFDCPTGPGDIIDDHRNGVLVPAEDVDGLTAALTEMASDEALRRRCGEAAVATAERYTMAAIGPRWDEMLQALLRSRV